VERSFSALDGDDDEAEEDRACPSHEGRRGAEAETVVEVEGGGGGWCGAGDVGAEEEGGGEGCAAVVLEGMVEVDDDGEEEWTWVEAEWERAGAVEEERWVEVKMMGCGMVVVEGERDGFGCGVWQGGRIGHCSPNLPSPNPAGAMAMASWLEISGAGEGSR